MPDLTFVPLPLAGAFRIEPVRRVDARGHFFRTFCAAAFAEKGIASVFVQTNHSKSLVRGTIRGLHYQLPPAAEAKLVRCVRGEVQDVFVDLRAGSPTFRQWHAEVLSDDNCRLVYVPPGFAHGYQAMTDGAEVTYQASASYQPGVERQVRFDDPGLGIRWEVSPVIVSDKDRTCPDLPADFAGIVLGN